MGTKLNVNTSIVDYLKSQGQDSSLSARKDIAKSLGISNYSGTYSQNIQMLNALKNAPSVKAADSGNAKADTKADTKADVKADTKIETDTVDSGKPNGVDDKYWDVGNSTYTMSDDQKRLDSTVQSDLSNFKNLASNTDIISNSTWAGINSSFVVPSEVLEADRYLAEQLQKIQSGKTSYSDQVRDMMDKIMNREKFSYDVDADPLFQQALASAMNSGKQAMQDTIGQASALTGGYGSTYATTAGNQAYNAYIEDAYDNLPQYYQMALEAYQMEGDEMYRQYSMLSTEDDKEYNRNITAYDATYQYRNQKYNDAYTQYRDAKSDAFAMANLELSENSQIVNNAYNMYQASSNYADSMYQREYNTWLDSVNQAWQAIQTQRGAYESDRAFDEGVRQYEKSYAQTEEHFNKNLDFQNTWNEKNMAFEDKWNQKKMDFEASENAKNRAVKSSSVLGGYDLTGIVDSVDAQNAMLKAANSENVKSFMGSILKESGLSRRGWKASVNGKTKQFDNYEQYIVAKADEWLANEKISEHQHAYLMLRDWSDYMVDVR